MEHRTEPGVTGSLPRSLGPEGWALGDGRGRPSLFASWRLLVPFHSFWCTPSSRPLWCSEVRGAGEGGGVEAVKLQTSRSKQHRHPCEVLDPLAWFSSHSRPQAEPGESAQSTAREAGQLGCGVEVHRDRRQITCHFILATPATFPNHPGRGELIAIRRTSQKQR